MEMDQCTETLGPDDWTEEHPRYNATCEAFDDAFNPLVSEPLPDSAFFEEGLANDYLCAIDEILYALYGIGERADYTYPNDQPPSHPYREAIAQAKEIALDALKRAALTSLAATMTVADSVDDAGLQLAGAITVNDDPVPPRFRKATGSAAFRTRSSKYNDAETQALRQRQMDDLAFLSKQGRCYSVHPKYEGIFISGGELNMRLAGDFINEKAWSLEEKARDMLGLFPFEQLQCNALASKQVNDKWRNSIKHAAKVEKQLNVLADKDNQYRQHVGEFTKLAQAMYLCDGWAANTLPLVLSWLTGKKQITRQGIKAKIKRLEKRLA